MHFYIIPCPWQEKAAVHEPHEGNWEIWIRNMLELSFLDAQEDKLARQEVDQGLPEGRAGNRE